jgi:hypothetical protein
MLLVLLDSDGPRQRYIVRHLLERMLGWPVRFTADAEAYMVHNGPRLHYGAPLVHDVGHVVVPAIPLEAVKPGMTLPPPTLCDGLPVIHGDDPFADSFTLLSLVDELGAVERDAHGRVPSSALHVVRHRLSELALVDRWALRLAERLAARYPQLPAPLRRFRHVLTVDVDNGFRYHGRPALRQTGALVRDVLRMRAADALERMSVLLGRRRDPFDRYAELAALATTKPLHRAIAFLLMRGGGAHDHAVPRDERFQQRVRALSASVEVGLHPSYHSSDDATTTLRERDELQAVTGRAVQVSRQHFLRWRLPDTLRALASAGFTEDHSLGFPDRAGFRAGTCTPFPYYDLERDEETGLMLWPFACMDSALHDRMGIGADEALAHIRPLIDEVRGVGGTFVSTWHDRFLSDSGPWKGWWGVMERTVEAARP